MEYDTDKDRIFADVICFLAGRISVENRGEYKRALINEESVSVLKEIRVSLQDQFLRKKQGKQLENTVRIVKFGLD